MRQFIHRIIARYIEALPLVTFLAIIKFWQQEGTENWQLPYYIPSLISFFSISFILVQRQHLNSCFSGINIYFYAGAIGQLFSLSEFNAWLGQMQASAMLLCIFLVIPITFFTHPQSVFGCNKEKINTSHVGIFIGVCGTAAMIAFKFRGQFLLGELFPFVSVFFTHNILQVISTRDTKPPPLT